MPSFVLGDPWRTINAAAVPFWTVFCVQPALRALDAHLAASPRYRAVDSLAFQHGVPSAGIAEPNEWLAVARRHGATARPLALDPRRFPHDIATLARYGHPLADLPPAYRPWTPLDVATAVHSLHTTGLAGPH